MTTPALILPLDLQGSLASNTVLFEFHNVQMGQPAIVRCDYGPFSANSALQPYQLYAQGANGVLTLLTRDVDYRYAEMDVATSNKTGLDVYNAVVVINTTLSGVYAVSYQAIGGVNHPNVGLLTQTANAPTATSAPVAYSSIQKLPATFTPPAHQHDSRDFYGAEYIVNALGVLQQAVTGRYTPYGTTGASSAEARIAQKVSNFTTTLAQDATLLTADIAAHINTIGFFHGYTATMLGLGNVVNGGFSPANDVNGNPLPVYASPYTISQAILNKPSYVASNHASLTNNPHNDQANAPAIALQYVRNLNVITAYNSGDYATLFAANATESYLTSYEVTQAVKEAQAAQIAALVTAPLNTLTAAGGAIAQAQAANTAANTANTAANTTLTSTTTSLGQALLAVSNAQAANRHYRMVLGNMEYSALLSLLLQMDYSAYANGSSVSPTGYYAVPPLIDSLYLWLDVTSTANTYRQDSNGNTRLMTLVDRTTNARQFAANNLTTAPIFKPSQDVAQGVSGLTVSSVASFSTGMHLDQISGPAVSLTPGMTVFALVRTGPSGTPLALLTDISATPLASIVLQPSDGVAITMQTTSNWLPFTASASTNNVSQSALIVASISPEAETYNWLATSQPLPAGSPQGISLQGTTWPASYVQSAPMTRIGNASPTAASGGELSQLIIYNRQLSFKEVQAVIDYLRLVSSHNQAFTVDLSAQNAF